MKLHELLGLTALLLSTGAFAAPGHQLTGPGFKNIAYFTQDFTLAGNISTALRVGPVTSSGAGYGTSKLSTLFPGGAIGAMATLALPQPVNQGVALETAVTQIPANFLAFKPAINAWLANQGISTVILDYTQEIVVSTPLGPVKKALVFNARLDVDGRATYGSPKLVEASPTITEVTYTPLALKYGLPVSWGYADAGTLKWRMLNQKNEALTGWTTINVGGVYDEPEGAGFTDPELKVRCVVDSRGEGCGGAIDARTLMGQTGSTYGLINYVRGVEPSYVLNADGSETAKLAVSVDSRTWDCVTYANSGAYGMELSVNVDRYLATAGGASPRITLLQQLSTRAVSAQQPYALSMPYSTLAGDAPESILLSPIPGETTWSQADPVAMSRVVSVAPLTLIEPCHAVAGGGYSDVYPPPPVASSDGGSGGNDGGDGGSTGTDGGSCSASDSASDSGSCSAGDSGSSDGGGGDGGGGE